ncbi:hypothetical protein QQZ08_001149 [Neonectria magnoliae]|uniref:Uncharacterized protein n=1 Tax=Neonectria magnoliae TaxID=2732573 RepID=A0ABR1IF65_9HYPO
MSRIVKLVGSDTGLVAEAVHNHRNSNRPEPNPSSAPNPSQGSSSLQPGPRNNQEHSDDDDDGLSKADELAADGVAWGLNDMTERVAPPSYETSEAAQMPSPSDSDEVKAEKQDKLVLELVQMAKLPPTPKQRLPCPVILP